jgi:hypothetical protein
VGDHPYGHQAKTKSACTARRVRNTKFQADLAPAEDRALRTLKEDLQLRSNTDFLADAVALFRWAVSERRLGHRIISETLSGERKVLVFPRLERVAPEAGLPRIEIAWTEAELASLAGLVSHADPHPPTPALIRGMRDRMAVIIRRLEESDDTGAFDCGDAPLNNYLHKYAWSNQEKSSVRSHLRGGRGGCAAHGVRVLHHCNVECPSGDVSQEIRERSTKLRPSAHSFGAACRRSQICGKRDRARPHL